MKSDKFTPLLERYVDNELKPEELARVEAHLPTCPDCRRVVNELRELQVMLRTSPLVECPESYWAKMADRFWETWNLRKRARHVVPSRPMPFFSSARLVALAAAAVLLVAVGVVTLRSVRTILPVPEMGIEPSLKPDTLQNRVPAAATPGETRTGAEPRSTEQNEQAAPSLALSSAQHAAGSPAKVATATVQKPTAGGALPKTSGEASGTPGATVNRMATAAANKANELPPSAPTPKSDYGGGMSTGQGKASPTKKSVKMTGEAVKRAEGAPDTTIYADFQLDAKPVMLTQPDFPDSINSRFAGLQLPLWVVIEKNGAVSQAELRTTMDIGGLEPAALNAVRQAHFSPGKIGDQPVRTAMLIVVTIRGKSGKND